VKAISGAVNAMHKGLCQPSYVKIDKRHLAVTEGENFDVIQMWVSTMQPVGTLEKPILQKNLKKQKPSTAQGSFRESMNYRQKVYQSYNSIFPGLGLTSSGSDSAADLQNRINALQAELAAKSSESKSGSSGVQNVKVECPKPVCPPGSGKDIDILVKVAAGEEADTDSLSEGGKSILNQMKNQCTTAAVVFAVLMFILPIAVASLFILRSASDDDNAKDDEDDDAE